jgi:hypothetical protein
MSRTYGLTGVAVLNTSAYLHSTSHLFAHPQPWNPFVTGDSYLTSLLSQGAATADACQRAATYRRAMARVVDLACVAPVVTIDRVSVPDTKITGWKAANLDVPQYPAFMTRRK